MAVRRTCSLGFFLLTFLLLLTIWLALGVGVAAAASRLTLTARPTTVIAGMPFSVGVVARDSEGNVSTGYTGTVQFTSSDTGLGGLPSSYTFKADDNGAHWFGVVLPTPGVQSITATDRADGATGTATVTVTPAASPEFAVTIQNAGALNPSGWYTSSGCNLIAAITPLPVPVNWSWIIDGVGDSGSELPPQSYYPDQRWVQGEGEHTYIVTATDAQGNTASAWGSFQIDSIGPAIQTTTTPALSANGHAAAPLTVNVHASDAGSGMSAISCTVDGVESDTSADSPGWPADGSFQVDAVGPHDVICGATDTAGNSSVHALSVQNVARQQDIAAGSYFYLVAFPDAQDGWVAAWDRLLHTSDGGVSWSPQTIGIDDYHLVSGIAAGDKDHCCVSANSSDGQGFSIYYTTDGGANWSQADLSGTDAANGSSTAVCFADPHDVWVGATGDRLLRSTDGGQTWTESSIPTDDRSEFIQFVTFFPKAGSYVGCAVVDSNPDGSTKYNYIARTTDGGATWSRALYTTSQTLLRPTFADAEHGWVGANEVEHAGGCDILVTSNGGASWTYTRGPQVDWLDDLALSSDGQHGIAVGSFYTGSDATFVTTDGGTNWSTHETAPPGGGLSSVAFLDASHACAVGSGAILIDSFDIYLDGSLPLAPTVTSAAIDAITTSGASAGGEVTDPGSKPVSDRGVYLSTSDGFTPPDQGTKLAAADPTGTGVFSCPLSGLSPATTYYVRAYASNEVGTSYGEQRSFTTAPAVTRYEDSDSRLTYYGAGRWMTSTNASDSGGTMHTYSAGPGNQGGSGSVTATFTGTGISVLATTMLHSRLVGDGIMHVSLDGVAQPDVNLGTGTISYKQIVFSATGLSAGPHTLSLSGTMFDLDALDIAGTLTQSP
jgi:photosystem II stability/assembly factor-like uncharacterized protein